MREINFEIECFYISILRSKHHQKPRKVCVIDAVITLDNFYDMFSNYATSLDVNFNT